MLKTGNTRRTRKYPMDMKFDYKDAAMLSRFVTEFGRIVPRRITGLSALQQRKLTSAIKKSRILGFLGFINRSPSDFS